MIIISTYNFRLRIFQMAKFSIKSIKLSKLTSSFSMLIRESIFSLFRPMQILTHYIFFSTLKRIALSCSLMSSLKDRCEVRCVHL